ncbi:ciliary microtubule inner protein 5 isoform X1 [Herpailurus yagouaroundi]|uniref:ciliary microtubule inner protein 5 isoform X1 n=1 Tax=Herpailurus yagouaroundi TaxID=1608482 RepID=UPI001AD79FDE|nr:uncharacterized protein C2orf50 homolog isoform X1 [Puma yagouaroundi]
MVCSRINCGGSSWRPRDGASGAGREEGACDVAGERAFLFRRSPQFHEPGCGQQGGHAPGANPHRHGLLLRGGGPEEEAGSRAAARVRRRRARAGGPAPRWVCEWRGVAAARVNRPRVSTGPAFPPARPFRVPHWPIFTHEIRRTPGTRPGS